MKYYGKLALIAALVALSGCQSGSNKSASAAPVDPEMDRCGASQYQQYVGKPLASVSSLRFENAVRAIPYNSAVTMDFNLNRINFMADQQGNISQVYCG
ncbi:MAG TPA: peptidase inhibitor I78 family protein [Erwinia persicina]|uniref:Peptidase inhibitor I78 family protein n=1 Tax=Erwinia persicina TaxID=55211 RepID=A0A3S7S655_9GAMM|nr:I78 family peptidase inhibitor [Erwinia persicina]AXU96209.1 peptidase inhibitor I78 family protein [Erwinia persicina]MBC3946519.1 peptidase inhibitor I78 family protein [Erwinia persicina]MBD8106316.1 peptidase inhibitor I78 family protein [Erwinia persicina]MBD8166804.1 peptidase inhibitor I78 family protein [Erwinia persicina]MBD8209312.1 peptidase inhibitor I78 family protein [Erwinia persicina]